jgi:hypothetical protein
VKASGAQTGGSFGLVEVSTPQGSGPPPHVHEDEAFYVLEGGYEMTVGNDRFDAREGCFIFAPRRVPHGYVVRAAPARHLVRIPQRMGDVLSRRGPGDGRRGSRSGNVRGVGEGARRHVARPAACSVSAVAMTERPGITGSDVRCIDSAAPNAPGERPSLAAAKCSRSRPWSRYSRACWWNLQDRHLGAEAFQHGLGLGTANASDGTSIGSGATADKGKRGVPSDAEPGGQAGCYPAADRGRLGSSGSAGQPPRQGQA